MTKENISYDEKLSNGELRCVVFEDKEQCNQELGHLGNHHFGLDSILAPFIKYAENVDCVEWVREVRDVC